MGLRVLWATACFFLLTGTASAIPIAFSGTPTNGSWNDAADSGVGFDGGSSFDITFTLDASTQDLSSVLIQIAMATFDNNFTVEVNSTEVVPVDPNDPAVFTPAIATPWFANSNGLDRLIISLTPVGISFAGSETTSSTSLTAGLVYAQPVVTPVFVDGLNTLRLVNPDDIGLDGIDFAITGTVSPLLVPEPNTASLVLLGLGLLAARRRTRR